MAKLLIEDVFPTAITYVSDGTVGTNGSTYIMLDIEDFPGLDTSEADVATDDAGEFLRQLMLTYVDAMSQIETGNLPQNFGLTQSNPRGTAPDRVQQTISAQFTLALSPQRVDIAPEA